MLTLHIWPAAGFTRCLWAGARAVRDKETRLISQAIGRIGSKFSPSLSPEFWRRSRNALRAADGEYSRGRMKVEESIMMVIWVALGGRGRLWGAIFGHCW